VDAVLVPASAESPSRLSSDGIRMIGRGTVSHCLKAWSLYSYRDHPRHGATGGFSGNHVLVSHD